MARYGSGEYFGPHHDAFPTEVALEKGYQRIATLRKSAMPGGDASAVVADVAAESVTDVASNRNPNAHRTVAREPGFGRRPFLWVSTL